MHIHTQTPLEKAREAKSRGNALFKQRQFEEALQCYKEALEICPSEEIDDIATFQHNIAAVYENMVSIIIEYYTLIHYCAYICRLMNVQTMMKR